MSWLRNDALKDYVPLFNLSTWAYAGQLVLIHRSMTKPVDIWHNFDLVSGKFEDDGRVTVVEFDNFYLFSSYCPNLGYDDNSLRRNKDFNKKLLIFVKDQRFMKKPLIWVGDMNAIYSWVDVVGSRALWERISNRGRFNKDTKKGSKKPKDNRNRMQYDNIGQPCTTRGEATRFKAVIEAGNLVDSYRLMHPIPNIKSYNDSDKLLYVKR